MLAVIFESFGPLDKAIHHYKKTLETRPNFLDTYIRLGITHEKQREFEKSREIWEQILRIDPSNKLAAEMLEKLSEKDF